MIKIILGPHAPRICENKKQLIEIILDEYREHSVCVGEVLHSVEIQGLSVQEVVDIFGTIMSIVEGDELIQFMNDREDEVPRICKECDYSL